MNRLKRLEDFGQSVWLDFVSREFLQSGDLQRMVEDDGLKGMTSNPAIFEKAFSHGTAYDGDIRQFTEEGLSVGTMFRRLSIADIQNACDALRPVYDRTSRADGFVSIEVSPYIAFDTKASMAEARSLWDEVARPNLMVKIPGTREGLPAIEAMIGEGVNINITLLFARSMYEQVLEAYLSGLETLSRRGSLDSIASVASFFVSRIDSKVDAELDAKIAQADAETRKALEALKGKIAIANAKLAYQHYKEVSASQRWQKLAAQGAHPQRLLWASTSTKNKAYPDTIYVDALIGRDTVNTIPPETLDAFRDHGHPSATLEADVDSARHQLAQLEKVGISLDRITDELVREGVDKFAEAADQLFAALATKRAKTLGDKLVKTEFALRDAGTKFDTEIAVWAKDGKIRRLWGKDKTVWTGTDEDRWLGWLDISKRELPDAGRVEAFARDVRGVGTKDAVLLGMGGSSLGAEVLADTFGRSEGWPRLHVLDSTDPEQILTLERTISAADTLFIVSSKSGSTLEPNILRDHFLHVTRESEGNGKAGTHFIAITDPGSSLEQEARRDEFREIFLGDPAIGGRFSVLSKFGLVPAALTGIDVARLLKSAECMRESCADMVPPSANPGVRLGIALGVLARDFHRDKITLVASPEIASLGAWLEQLIAESTGKEGKGLIPVDGESLGDSGSYGNDRVFVHLRFGEKDGSDAALSALEEHGHPVIRLAITDRHQIAQMFFVWEMAIAVAGAVIGINPFDQPDVEAAKQKTRALTDQIERGDSPPRGRPDFVHDGVSVFADPAISEACSQARSLAECLRLHLGRIATDDYFALLAYMQRNGQHAAALEGLRLRVRDRKRIATCMGFGPRYLHSTGQAYKGGPNSGVFLTLTCDHAEDVPLENRKLSFGAVELAQAQGDFAVLNDRGRRAVRVHLHDVARGLGTLTAAVEQALG
ncbi:MAG TPA: bifunctional transaldolase/phosoglucose isomerase [Rhizomicrobium sp.]|jgi:transaldolase/glucose-6-phosphate isomerase|nr:bifunctional transaldolase/phosoglucose isomerase [Rhizomicrobium sp.]